MKIRAEEDRFDSLTTREFLEALIQKYMGFSPKMPRPPLELTYQIHSFVERDPRVNSRCFWRLQSNFLNPNSQLDLCTGFSNTNKQPRKQRNAHPRIQHTEYSTCSRAEETGTYRNRVIPFSCQLNVYLYLNHFSRCHREITAVSFWISTSDFPLWLKASTITA